MRPEIDAAICPSCGGMWFERVPPHPCEEVAALKETISTLNRRCQRAESAARETAEAVQKKGASFGRGLANWYAGQLERDIRVIKGKVKFAVEENCSCGGSGPGEGYEWCDLYHEIYGTEIEKEESHG